MIFFFKGILHEGCQRLGNIFLRPLFIVSSNVNHFINKDFHDYNIREANRLGYQPKRLNVHPTGSCNIY